MSFQTSIQKAFSVTALVGISLAIPSPGLGGASAGAASAHQPAARRDARTHAGLLASPLVVVRAKRAEPRPAPEPKGPCGAGMILVEGEHCPEAEQVCLRWLDPPPYQTLRCGEYAKPAKCTGSRQPRRFCIDREEFAEKDASRRDPDEVLPLVGASWTEAKALCEQRGARLCKESEWEFACEGPDMNPYPYGFKREAGVCNVDRTDLGGAQDKLRDHRAPLSAFPQCTSAFGAHDMTGNVDEWVEREGVSAPNRSALRGGWWLPGRNRCRAATLGHGEAYAAKQVGFRCCADAE